MLCATCHWEAPKVGVARKEKVGVVHAGLGIGGAKGRGREEGRGWTRVEWEERQAGGCAVGPGRGL